MLYIPKEYSKLQILEHQLKIKKVIKLLEPAYIGHLNCYMIHNNNTLKQLIYGLLAYSLFKPIF